jgi:hypothetical protein
MSLARLLTTGKSLVGTKSQTGRYQLRRQRLLPKFESAKNPFRTGQAPAENPAKAPRLESAEVRTVQHPTATEERAKTNIEQPTANIQNSPSKVEQPASNREPRTARSEHPPSTNHHPPSSTKAAGCERKPGRLSMLVRALLGWRPQAHRPVTLPRPRLPVQGELSLSTVKVVRNDLKDAEWELAPSRPAASKPRTAASQPEAGVQRPPAKSAGPSARHLFDVSKSCAGDSDR